MVIGLLISVGEQIELIVTVIFESHAKPFRTKGFVVALICDAETPFIEISIFHAVVVETSCQKITAEESVILFTPGNVGLWH